MAERLDPFTLVFGPMAEERFPALRASLEQSGRDPRDRDAFLLDRAVVELLRDLVPEEHDPAEIDDFVATLHHAYLFWLGGRHVVAIAPERAASLLATETHSAPPSLRPSAYCQFPERLIWGQLTADGPHEPLDGIFLHPRGDALAALGVFGLHADRPGLSVAEVIGPRPAPLARVDGSPIFSPVLPGGGAAGLHSLAGGEELLELAWRAGEGVA